MSPTSINRREALKLAGVAGAGVLGGTLATTALRQAAPTVEASPTMGGTRSGAGFFTPHERRMVDVLVDDILPRDERSGSATEAGVPEFMETILLDEEVTPPLTQLEMRGGLAWLDAECRRRFGRGDADCEVAQRHKVLDDIAWPAKARPGMRFGAEFFNKLRDFTASGFFSSEIGHKDLRYQGGVFTPVWTGCSETALQRLGVSYAAWDARYGSTDPSPASGPAHRQLMHGEKLI